MFVILTKTSGSKFRSVSMETDLKKEKPYDFSSHMISLYIPPPRLKFLGHMTPSQ